MHSFGSETGRRSNSSPEPRVAGLDRIKLNKQLKNLISKDAFSSSDLSSFCLIMISLLGGNSYEGGSKASYPLFDVDRDVYIVFEVNGVNAKVSIGPYSSPSPSQNPFTGIEIVSAAKAQKSAEMNTGSSKFSGRWISVNSLTYSKFPVDVVPYEGGAAVSVGISGHHDFLDPEQTKVFCDKVYSVYKDSLPKKGKKIELVP